MTGNADSKRKGSRVGRPPKDLAGGVQSRILDAAEQVFLKRGFQTASLDEIAELAPASKPTIYAHFAGKEALFAAVIARIIGRLTDFEGHTPKGRTVREKLTNLGSEIIERAIEDTVGVTRAAIAEADRVPELSRRVHEAARDRTASAVARLLNEATPTLARAPKGPFSPKRSVATAQIFMDLILLPMLMRALLGDQPKLLRREISTFVRERVGFFLAACEVGWED